MNGGLDETAVDVKKVWIEHEGSPDQTSAAQLNRRSILEDKEAQGMKLQSTFVYLFNCFITCSKCDMDYDVGDSVVVSPSHTLTQDCTQKKLSDGCGV